MRKVQKIVDTRGGLEALKHRSLSLRVPSFMRLVIEYIGSGPRGGALVFVAHYGEQNGKLMRDEVFPTFRTHMVEQDGG